MRVGRARVVVVVEVDELATLEGRLSLCARLVQAGIVVVERFG